MTDFVPSDQQPAGPQPLPTSNIPTTPISPAPQRPGGSFRLPPLPLPSLNNVKTIVSALALGVLVTGAGAGYYLSTQNQDLRRSASASGVTYNIAPTEADGNSSMVVGQERTFLLMTHSREYIIAAFDVHMDISDGFELVSIMKPDNMYLDHFTDTYNHRNQANIIPTFSTNPPHVRWAMAAPCDRCYRGEAPDPQLVPPLPLCQENATCYPKSTNGTSQVIALLTLRAKQPGTHTLKILPDTITAAVNGDSQAQATDVTDRASISESSFSVVVEGVDTSNESFSCSGLDSWSIDYLTRTGTVRMAVADPTWQAKTITLFATKYEENKNYCQSDQWIQLGTTTLPNPEIRSAIPSISFNLDEKNLTPGAYQLAINLYSEGNPSNQNWLCTSNPSGICGSAAQSVCGQGCNTILNIEPRFSPTPPTCPANKIYSEDEDQCVCDATISCSPGSALNPNSCLCQISDTPSLQINLTNASKLFAKGINLPTEISIKQVSTGQFIASTTTDLLVSKSASASAKWQHTVAQSTSFAPNLPTINDYVICIKPRGYLRYCTQTPTSDPFKDISINSEDLYFGDINSDNIFSILDIAKAKLYLTGPNVTTDSLLTSTEDMRMLDLDSNGKYNVIDYARLLSKFRQLTVQGD